MHILRRLLLGLVALPLRLVTPGGRPVPRRVLVVKPDHLGDLLLLTPALSQLREALPEAHIALMIGPWSAAAIRGNPSIDALLFCDFPGFTRRPKPGLLQPYAQLLRTAMLLCAGKYDTAIIARDDHWWGALLTALAGIPRRIGYAAPDVAPLLTEALPYHPTAHVTRQALDLVAYVTSELDPQNSTFNPPPPLMHAPITPDDDRWAGSWLKAHRESDAKLVAIHPGAGGQAKLWIAARWAMVADALMVEGYEVVLTGGPGERELVADICGRLSQRPLLLVGEATLGQLAAFYRRCDLVLGVDSGPLHLAASAGVPTVVLFGPIDERRFGSWGPPGRHHFIRSGLWCSPCGAVDACPRGMLPSECMTRISASTVLAAAFSALDHQVKLDT